MSEIERRRVIPMTAWISKDGLEMGFDVSPEGYADLEKVTMDHIRSSGLMHDLYLFFDSSVRPITPMEFLHFWNFLSRDEKFYYATTPLH